MDIPMDKAEVVNSLNSQDTLCHVELCNVFRKGVVLDQPANRQLDKHEDGPSGCHTVVANSHRHQIASR